jgi:hypothetical protein
MNIKFSSIADRGVPKKERLVLKVVAKTDVGEYAVFRTGISGSEVTTDVMNTFWFPDKPVAAGDLVVLYSKSGTQNEKELERGGRAHFFYWGVGGTLWDSKEHAVVITHIDEWISHIQSAK